MFYTATEPSPAGNLTLACDGGERLVGLWIEGQKYHGAKALGNTREGGDMRIFAQIRDWLRRYFAGENPGAPKMPIAPAGGDFRRGVWDILSKIPYGEVTTYGAVAKKLAAMLGKKSVSAQAVGGAVAHNPVSIIIPCHRVVGANGSLTGYAGGIETKLALLTLEGADVSGLFMPK